LKLSGIGTKQGKLDLQFTFPGPLELVLGTKKSRTIALPIVPDAKANKAAQGI